MVKKEAAGCGDGSIDQCDLRVHEMECLETYHRKSLHSLRLEPSDQDYGNATKFLAFKDGCSPSTSSTFPASHGTTRRFHSHKYQTEMNYERQRLESTRNAANPATTSERTVTANGSTMLSGSHWIRGSLSECIAAGCGMPTDTENPLKILKLHGLVMGDGEDMPMKF